MAETEDEQRVFNPRTAAIAQLLSERNMARGASILVVGCGSGREAAVLAQDLEARVTGIDILDGFDPVASRMAELQVGDAQRMAFPDASFDAVFSYHALEHIPEPHRALAEMRRVLKADGQYCVGTPNRHRLLGYIGGESTLVQKIGWNVADMKARVLGRFRNELGAHAGFSASELKGLLLKHFSTADDVTHSYYRRLYRRHPLLVTSLARSGLGQVVFPSVYFIGRR